MISGEYYYTIYLSVVTILTFIVCNTRLSQSGDKIGSLLLCIFMILFIGLRPSDRSFVDMWNYGEVYEISEWEGFQSETENLIFDNLFTYMAGNEIDISLFYLLIATIYFACMLIACNKIFSGNTFLAFLVCLAAFSTFSYGTNGIKAGAAASIFLVAIAYSDKLLLSIVLAIISWGFHHSMQLPIVAYLISILYRKNSVYFIVWGVCLLLAMVHFTSVQTLLAGLTDEKGADYLTQIDAEFVTHKGFRFDFVIYSVIPIAIGYIALYYFRFQDRLYGIILRTYLLANAVWLLCMYAPFTNRIAYLSWFLYPIVIIYPSIKNDGVKYSLTKSRNWIVAFQLTFTLFMTFVYYG